MRVTIKQATVKYALHFCNANFLLFPPLPFAPFLPPLVMKTAKRRLAVMVAINTSNSRPRDEKSKVAFPYPAHKS